MVEISPDLTGLSLPQDFPQQVVNPKFAFGDRVQWHPLPTQDFGVVVGVQYAPTGTGERWDWQYTIWLDEESPSRGWVRSDTAWEGDLELRSAPTQVL